MDQVFNFQLTIQDPEGERTFPLPSGTTQVGRQEGNHLILADLLVSRWHAELVCGEGTCWLKDLGSANGTKVNGERIQPQVPVSLVPGTVIEIGAYTLTLHQVTSDPLPSEVHPVPLEPADGPEDWVSALESLGSTELPPLPPLPAVPLPVDGDGMLLPEYALSARRFLSYLPEPFHTDFMERFLAIFETILSPIEWTVDNFDIYLHPATAPEEFLPWLSHWFLLTFDTTWSEGQRRLLLAEAHQIFARRGTAWALRRMLEIYTGHTPEIIDLHRELAPFTFRVKLPFHRNHVDPDLLAALIDAHKPAHTTYILEFGQ